MPSRYDDIDSENPGVIYAREQGVDITLLHEKIKDTPFRVLQFTEAELRVLAACIEVACGF